MQIFLNGHREEIDASALSGVSFVEMVKESDVVAMEVNGKLVDLTDELHDGDKVRLIKASDSEGLEIMRHSCAHLLAYAMQQIYPNVKIAIGPVIEDGFYYDFDLDSTISESDLPKIEEKMRELISRGGAITHRTVSKSEAREIFKKDNEIYKLELIDSIPDGQEIKIYQEGAFTDLCRGPHLTSIDRIAKSFKLVRVAGAYWRGDVKNKMLQRIYAICFNTQEELDAHIKLMEEASKRDHRKLAKQLDLFHLQEEAVGSIFWHPRGYAMYRSLENYVRAKVLMNGYQEVKTPQLMSKSIWETSGHWDKFRENMFVVNDDDKVLAIKPMNCPAHIMIYNTNLISYRNLPIRYAEFGVCHRNESSGSMHGIMRLRSFVQDDGHIFCAPEQINAETVKFCDLLKEMYKELGFEKIKIKYSDRPAVRAGSDEVWDIAEKALWDAANNAGLEMTTNKGEGAFYGPKLEFVLQDAIGRDWQCGTFQVDFILPERFGIEYVGEDGQKHTPVLLHRAVLGSLERFIGILIEHYSGNVPLWLAPEQVVVATITSDVDEYAQSVYKELLRNGVRAILDDRNEKISYKIREHSSFKRPLVAVIGAKERDNRTLAVREFGSDEQHIMTVEEIIAKIKKNCLF